VCAVLAFGLLPYAALAAKPTPRVDATEAIDALWAQTLATGNADKILGAYRDVSLALGEGGVVDAALCEKHKIKIEAATQANPVGIDVWRVAWRCAEALRDRALVEQRRRHLEALLRHAFGAVPADGGRTPIRILDEADAAAIIAESGMEAIDLFYERGEDSRHLRLDVTLLDAATGTERRLVFDMLAARLRLVRDGKAIKFPAARDRIADRLLDSYAESDSIAAKRTVQLRRLVADGMKDVGEAVATGLRDNNKVLIYTIAMRCTTPRVDPACGTSHIDALLPYAEKRFSPALVWLAQAYRVGAGVPRDEAKARALLDAADRRAGGVNSRIRLARFLRFRGETGLPALLRGPIEAAARRGDLSAQITLVEDTNTVQEAARWSPLQREAARRAAEAGSAAGQFAWSLRLAAERRNDDAVDWLRRAAINDETRAQAALAQRYGSGEPSAADTKNALHWYERAAYGGDAAAMFVLGRHALQPPKPDYAEAAGWFDNAALRNHVGARVELAKLYTEGAGPIARDEARAATLLRPIVDDPARTDARHQLAWLLRFGRDIEHDLVEAERLLRNPADRDDPAMQHQLADLLLWSPDVPERVAEAVALLRRAAPVNDNASGQLAIQLWYGRGIERDKAAAKALWEPLVEKGEEWWINNYAWALCTADDASVDDARKGVAAFARRKRSDALPPAYEDTLAACHAAAGDFAAAAQSQQRAIDVITLKQPDAKATLAAFRERLGLYKAGKPFREKIAGS
jgi:TPR repeat protein